MYFGTNPFGVFHSPGSKEHIDLSAARGEVVANNLNVAGKKQFIQRKRSTWLAHQSLQMLIPSAREQIEIDRDQYTWVDPDSGETVKDGMTVLYHIEYSWCTEDHWSAGIKHNGMYQLHDTHGHADWRKRVDAEKAAKRDGAVSSTADQTNETSNADQKKLALSDKLRAALTTHAGLSQDAFSRIWSESCEDSGN